MRVAHPAALEAPGPVAVEGSPAEGLGDLALDVGDEIIFSAVFASFLANFVVELLELGVEGRGPVRDGVSRGLGKQDGEKQ